MKIFYNLLSKKNSLIKQIMIYSLIIIVSVSVLYLPQVANPHNLRNYFRNFSNGGLYFKEGTIDWDRYGYDFETTAGQSSSLGFFDNFSDILETTSKEVYGLFEPSEYYCISKLNIYINNLTIDNQFSLIPISSRFYNEIGKLLNTTFIGGSLIITNTSSFSSGSYNITYNNQNTSISINYLIESNLIETYYPSLKHQIFGNQQNDNLTNIILMPVVEFSPIFDNLEKSFSNKYHFEVYIKFSDFQKDVIFWSINSQSLLLDFEETLIANLQSVESTLTIQFFRNQDFSIANNSILIKTIFSFIRGIQITIWIISIAIVGLTISQVKKSGLKKEMRILMAGEKWSTRLISHFSEISIIEFCSCLIALPISFLFMKAQILIGLDFSFTKAMALGYGLIPICFLCLLFGFYFDFEFYLRRILETGFSSEKYRPFTKIPNIVKVMLIPVAFLLVWLLNKSLTSLLFQLGYIIVVIIIASLVGFLIKSLLKVIYRFSIKRKRKVDQPRSVFNIICQLFNKSLVNRVRVFSFLLTIVSLMFFYTAITADGFKNGYLLMHGSEISVTVNADSNSTLIKDTLINNSNILDYTIISMINHNQVYNITVLKESFDNDSCSIYGLNIDDYFNFYKTWNKRNWLQSGTLDALDNQSIFVSLKFKEYNYDIGDNLVLKDNLSLTIAGFLNEWSGISDIYCTKSQLIVALTQPDMLHIQGFAGNGSVSYTYKIHVKPKNIIPTVNYLNEKLSALDSFEEITAIDFMIFIGVRIVFLYPICLLFELFILIMIALTIYSNIVPMQSNENFKLFGLISMNADYRKPFRNYKIFENILFSFLFVLILSLFLLLGSISWVLLSPGDFSFSSQTILYTGIFFALYIALLFIQSSIEYISFKKLKLNLLYRHSE